MKNLPVFKVYSLTSRQWLIAAVLFCGFFVNRIGLAGELEEKKNLNDTKPRNNSPCNTPDFTIPNKIALVECGIGIMANGLLLLVTVTNPLKNLRRTSWITITNLAIADLLTSIASIPFCFESSLDVFKTRTAIGWGNFGLNVCYSASFFILFLFAVERYIAVMYPIEASNILTKRRVCLVCLMSWLAATLMGVPWVMTSPHRWKIRFAMFFVLHIVTIVMVIVQVLIIRQIWVAGRGIVSPSYRRDAHRKDIVVTLVILVLVLVVTTFPFFTVSQIETLAYSLGYQCGNERFNFLYYYYPVSRLNFVVNPFVYAWRLADYRSAFVAFFTLKWAAERPLTPKTSMSSCDKHRREVKPRSRALSRETNV